MNISIGIYSLIENKYSLQKISQRESRTGVFAYKAEEDFEKYSLPQLPLKLNTINHYTFEMKREFHYCKIASNQQIMVIISRGFIENSELYYLFRNIQHVLVRGKNSSDVNNTSRNLSMISSNSSNVSKDTNPNTIDTTLGDIVTTPVNYIARDILIGKVKEEILNTKEIMLKNIDKIIERGEKLDSLMDRAIKLETDSVKFNKSSRSINKCC